MTKYTNDLEDSSQLDADEVETFEFWATKQKDLVTSTVDYNLSTLAELINDETIDLNPTHQRRLRWNLTKQSRLIESFLMNVPVPPIFLNEDEYGRYSVIDGKQRLSAVTSFLSNNLVLEGLQIFSDINGNKFNDLPSKLRSIIRTRPTLRAIIILRQSDSDLKNEVFHRLNTGGEHLNPQEIRNNAYHGTLNSLIVELSESKMFHNVLGIKNKYRSEIYQEMRDAEFVLRFFTFKDDWEVFTGGVRRRMDSFMSTNRNPDDRTLSAFRHSFLDTLGVVTSVFGDHAFHRWMPERHVWRNQVLAALYDAQMFSCQYYTQDQLFPYAGEIVAAFKGLFADDGFRRSIDAATNTPSYFKDRIRRLRGLIVETARLG
jgi:uncharacterized protein DUF262